MTQEAPNLEAKEIKNFLPKLLVIPVRCQVEAAFFFSSPDYIDHHGDDELGRANQEQHMTFCSVRLFLVFNYNGI